MSIILVDCEANGISPCNGLLTEFGAVEFDSRATFHGVLWEAEPSKENPAIPEITGKHFDEEKLFVAFEKWLLSFPGRPVFVSDNPAFDYQWISFYFDKTLGRNPFGHSGRRISDFWAGLQSDWRNTQKWKRLRDTPHTHMPVDDAMGNAEALQKMFFMIDVTGIHKEQS